ncbi:hypothetical protein BJX76DRAFT_327107 [Aspergillus varians]
MGLPSLSLVQLTFELTPATPTSCLNSGCQILRTGREMCLPSPTDQHQPGLRSDSGLQRNKAGCCGTWRRMPIDSRETEGRWMCSTDELMMFHIVSMSGSERASADRKRCCFRLDSPRLATMRLPLCSSKLPLSRLCWLFVQETVEPWAILAVAIKVMDLDGC